MSLLEVRDVEVHYGPIQALFGLSLDVGGGEKVALVGTNGAGKTTTLRTISGLIAPTCGEIVFDGERVDGMSAFDVIERGLAHLPEGRELFRDLSVVENLKLGHWVRRKERFKAKADEVMDHFPILRERANQAAGTLSGGEQQMLAVARALMSSPRLLVVDELSLGLAPRIVAQLFDILETINREGTSVVIVEQFVHMALEHTDRAYALAKGEVVLEGESSKLAGSPELMDVYMGEGAGEDATAPTVSGNGAGEREQRSASGSTSSSRSKSDSKGASRSKAGSRAGKKAKR